MADEQTSLNGGVSRDDASDSRQALLKARSRRYATQAAPPDTDLEPVVHFTRAGAAFAVGIAELSQIRKVSAITRIPGVSPVIAGVLSVGGRIVAVHDLAVTVGADTALSTEIWLLVGAEEHGDMALLADAVIDVRDEARKDWAPAPLSLPLPAAAVLGVRDHALWLQLDGLRNTPAFFNA